MCFATTNGPRRRRPSFGTLRGRNAVPRIPLVAPLGDGQKTNQAPRDVFLQRGASGIDGLIAGAAGVARASRRPTLLILGDVSAAHDLSSLAVARTVRTPLAVVVIDNGGGHIFDHLPLYQEMGEHPDFQLWTTPPRLDFKAAAKTYGVNFAAPPDIDSIAPAVATALTRPGATLLVIRTHPSSSREFMRTLSSGGAHPGSELN